MAFSHIEQENRSHSSKTWECFKLLLLPSQLKHDRINFPEMQKFTDWATLDDGPPALAPSHPSTI